MREINVNVVAEIISSMAIDANTIANKDLKDSLIAYRETEQSNAGKVVLGQLIDNIEIAEREKIPICQDTGFTVLYLNIGQDVHFTGGDLETAIQNGVSKGYTDGFLRKSIVSDPLTNPKNTGNNTPAIIHCHIVPGENVEIVMLPKGGGSENMSRIKMMTPYDGIEGVRKFVIETVSQAGSNPCPPIIVGVAVGGTFDYVAHLAKKSVTRSIGQRNPNPKLAALEIELLKEINKLGIGPAGLGGTTTALDLFIEEFPRHIASFPVAVNIQCHAARVKTHTI
jgi:fumarate hydratase subunit alpha